MWKGYLLATVLICFSQAAALRADDAGAGATVARAGEPDAAALAAKLVQLLAQAQDEAVRAPAKQAELALARARTSGDAGVKARQLGIARAALALAEARVALLRERELWSSANRRRIEAARRAEQAHTLLKQSEQSCPSCARPAAAATSGQP